VADRRSTQVCERSQAARGSSFFVAAVGDIACDPANTNFNGGLGTSQNCRQKYTSDLLLNAGLSAVLILALRV
jgi:hypothetical protein